MLLSYGDSVLTVLNGQRNSKSRVLVQWRCVRTSSQPLGITLRDRAEHVPNELFRRLSSQARLLSEDLDLGDQLLKPNHHNVSTDRLV